MHQVPTLPGIQDWVFSYVKDFILASKQQPYVMAGCVLTGFTFGGGIVAFFFWPRGTLEDFGDQYNLTDEEKRKYDET